MWDSNRFKVFMIVNLVEWCFVCFVMTTEKPLWCSNLQVQMQPEADAGDADAQRHPGETQRPSGGAGGAFACRYFSEDKKEGKGKESSRRLGWSGWGTTWAALAKSMTVLEGFGWGMMRGRVRTLVWNEHRCFKQEHWAHPPKSNLLCHYFHSQQSLLMQVCF